MPKQPQMLTAVPPGLCSETTQLEESVLLVCARKILEMLHVICDEKLQASYLLLGNCMTYNSSSSDEQEYDVVVLMFTTAT